MTLIIDHLSKDKTPNLVVHMSKATVLPILRMNKQPFPKTYMKGSFSVSAANFFSF